MSTWMVALLGIRHCHPCPRHLLGPEILSVRGSVTPKANSSCWLADGTLSEVDCSSLGILAMCISCPKAQTYGRCTSGLGLERAGSLHGVCMCWQIMPVGQSGGGVASVPWVTRRFGQLVKQLAQVSGAGSSTLLRQLKPFSTQRPRAPFLAGGMHSRLHGCFHGPHS